MIPSEVPSVKSRQNEFVKNSRIPDEPNTAIANIAGRSPAFCELILSMPKEIYLYNFFSIQPLKTGQKTGPRTNQDFLLMNWYVNTINLHWNFSNKYEHQKYKNRKPDRKLDQRESLWANEPVFRNDHRKYKNRNWTENRTYRNFSWVNQYDNINLPALAFFRNGITLPQQ